MKTLKNLASQIYGDRKVDGPELQFMAKHVIGQFGVTPDGKDYAGNPVDGAPYKATNKYYKRSPSHGHDAGADRKVYEETDLDEGMGSYLKTRAIQSKIKNKAKELGNNARKLYADSKEHGKLADRQGFHGKFLERSHKNLEDRLLTKSSKEGIKASKLNRNSKRIAGVVSKMTEERKLSPNERMKANSKLGKKNSSTEQIRQQAKTKADFNSSDLDESLLSNFKKNKIAGKIRDKASRLRIRSFNKVDDAEEMGRKFGRGSIFQKRDFARARKLKNKSNQLSHGADRVAGVVNKMMRNEESHIKEGKRLNRLQLAADVTRRPWKSAKGRIEQGALLGTSMGAGLGLATGVSPLGATAAGAATGAAAGAVYHAGSRTIEIAKKYNELKSKEPKSVSAPKKSLSQTIKGKLSNSLIKNASNRSSAYKWAVKNKSSMNNEQHDVVNKESYDKHHANAIDALQGMIKHLKNHKSVLDTNGDKADWSVTHPHQEMKQVSRQLQDTFEDLENRLTTNLDNNFNKPSTAKVVPMHRMGGTKYSNWKASN